MSQNDFYLRGQATLRKGIWQPGKTIIHIPAEIAGEIDKRNKHSSRLNVVGCTIEDTIRYAAITFDRYVHNPHPTVSEKMDPLGSVLFDLNGRAISHTQGVIEFLKPESRRLEILGNHNSVELWSPAMFKAYTERYKELGNEIARSIKNTADEITFGTAYAG